MDAFHAGGWAERAAIAETIEDGRYRDLARRIVCHGQPDALQPDRRQILEVWLQNRLQGRDGVEAGRTIGDALTELDEHTNASGAVLKIRKWLEEKR
jgi:exodeoxyribonuclease-1